MCTAVSCLLTVCFHFVTLCFICVQGALRQSRSILMKQLMRNASSRSQKQLYMLMALCPYPKMKPVSCAYITSVSLQQSTHVHLHISLSSIFPTLSSLFTNSAKVHVHVVPLKKEVQVNFHEQLLVIKPSMFFACCWYGMFTCNCKRYGCQQVQKGAGHWHINYRISGSQVQISVLYPFFAFFKCIFSLLFLLVYNNLGMCTAT